jgi:hypothetical protein
MGGVVGQFEILVLIDKIGALVDRFMPTIRTFVLCAFRRDFRCAGLEVACQRIRHKRVGESKLAFLAP